MKYMGLGWVWFLSILGFIMAFILLGFISMFVDVNKEIHNRKHHINFIDSIDSGSRLAWLKILSLCGLLGNIGMVVFFGIHDALSMEGIKLFICLIIFCAVLFCISLILIWASRVKYQKTHPHWREADFYDLCVKEGVSSAESKADVARARLVAKKYSISVPEDDDRFISFFRRGQEIVLNEEKQAEDSAKEKDLEEERVKEYSEKIGRERFTVFTGQEKRNRMLQYEIDVCQNAISENKSSNSSSPFLKEESWGLAGGIASGIAGPAAGLAAAADTMAYNQQVREYNQAVAQFYALAAAQGLGGYTSPSSTREYYEKRIKELKKRQEETALKLVDEDCDIRELFQHLHFSEEELSISKTGSVRVSVKVSADALYVFESVPAVIDGYVRAKIKEKGKTVGSAKLCFPLSGVSDKGCTVYGICTDLNDLDAVYSVSFKPGKLWLIEAG